MFEFGNQNVDGQMDEVGNIILIVIQTIRPKKSKVKFVPVQIFSNGHR